mmetsp:Transcript_91468/g.295973  ORF Transcript_91468/g.295973 Transcript_91468/m.295973 type:complete len:306 (-) Transcript_91468:352-1269(-)
MLFQTWVTLDCPGLNDSMTSVGMGDTYAFEQHLGMGAQERFQPRICLTLFQTSDLGPGGKLLLAPDAPSDLRSARWGALLRSQHQHAVLSAALHLAERDAAAAPSVGEGPRAEDLHAQVDAQARDIERLRAQLRAGASNHYGGGCGSGSGGEGLPVRQLELSSSAQPRQARRQPRSEDGRGESEEELARSNEAKRAEIETLKSDLEQMQEEANSKIDGANERIRALRRNRDEARDEVPKLRDEAGRLNGDVGRLRKEFAQLAEEKEVLLGIVEDLHQTCVNAGLEAAGRRSIDSVTEAFRFTPRT